jgi:hypothetical protein
MNQMTNPSVVVQSYLLFRENEHGGPVTTLQTQQPKHNPSGKQSGQGPTK